MTAAKHCISYYYNSCLFNGAVDLPGAGLLGTEEVDGGDPDPCDANNAVIWPSLSAREPSSDTGSFLAGLPMTREGKKPPSVGRRPTKPASSSP